MGIAQPALASSVNAQTALEDIRRAQQAWAAMPVAARLRILSRFRGALAADARELAKAVSPNLARSEADTLVSEVLPLAEACRFLEDRAEKLLAPRLLDDDGKPFWIGDAAMEIRREPLGVVLILGPYNYPLFLPGVQALQALAAGNAVIWKPGRDAAAVAHVMRRLLVASGLDARLVTVTTEDPESAKEFIQAGVDKVALTGSAETGVEVLRQLAPHLTPAVMELSGCDAAVVRDDADLGRAVHAITFGMRLNGGATCIAPRRVIAFESIAMVLEQRLAEAAAALPAVSVAPDLAERARQLVDQAIEHGARRLAGSIGFDRISPVVLTDASPRMALLQADLFAPVLSIQRVRNDDEAAEAVEACPYALGATVFGEERAARALAVRLNVGVVVINDAIVPTADPRLPFGGRRRSGFGVTRGEEGLLEFTALKTIACRRGSRVPHLDAPHPHDAELFAAYLAAVHGGSWRARLKGFRNLAGVLRRRTLGGLQ
ncbi:MAG: aldehyde dehydrogenase family protein [Proteobacteria bacterium]|nr:aldehyde dehydrogenase family protein [Pseudomonadota bacterium]